MEAESTCKKRVMRYETKFSPNISIITSSNRVVLLLLCGGTCYSVEELDDLIESTIINFTVLKKTFPKLKNT